MILAKPFSLVDDIMERDIVTVQVDQDQEEAALKLARYDFLAIPVVDEQRRLVGIITHDDVLDVVVEEATEDALHMGGVTPMEENYLDAAFTSVWWRMLRHELMMGLALGLTLGGIAFVRAAMTPASVLGNADRWMLALVISQSVATICLWGTLVGSMLPLLFMRLGFDPGYASSPFVATFVDVTGIVVYFSIAKLYLL